MADRSVKLLLTADVKGLVNGLKTGAQATKDFGRDLDSWAKKNEQQLDTVGKGAMVAGGVVAAGVGLAIKSFADFDKSMSSVQAATHETEGNMAQLRKAAIEAGADTAFSASEAAQAIEELAKAGVSTADIMGGGLDGSLALAAAGALDVGTAAELSATAMTQFKLSGEKIPHVADLLAAGAGKAQGSVEDMGAALKQSGLVASQVGLSIEETTGGLAAFASAGLVGSDAGTSFKSMLQRLTPQSDKAAKTMDELGLNAYDAQGNFVGLSEYAGILQGALSGMTAEQRNSTMATLFGSDAVRAAAVLYEQGADGVQKWEDAVNDAGYAAETAAIMQDNLAGDIEKLGGSLDSVFLKSGSGANDVLRGLVQGLEGLVDAVGDIPEPVLNMGLIFSGIAGGAALMGGAVITAVPKIRDTVEAFRDLNVSGSKIPGVMGKSAKAVGVAAVAYAGFATAAQLAAAAIDEKRTKTSVEQFTNALTGISDNAPAAAEALDRVFNGVSPTGSDIFTAVDDLESAMKRIGDPTVNDNISDFLGTAFGQNTTTGINAAKDALSNLDGALTQFATSGSFDDAAAGFTKAWEAGQMAGIPTRDLIDLFPQYRDAVSEAATAQGITQMSAEDLAYAMLGMGPAALGAASGADAAASATGELGGAAQEAALSLDDLLDALFALGMLEMSSRDATAAFEGALDDASATAQKLAEDAGGLGAALNKNASDFDLTSQAGRDANAAFQDVARSGMAEFEAKAREGAGTKELQGSLRDTYSGLMSTLEGFGITGAGAEALARSVLGIPKDVSIKTWASEAAKGVIDSTGQAADNLNGKHSTVTIETRQVTTYVEKREGTPISKGIAAYSGIPGRATGGAIFGPGTGTSDSIPALLSNGEHVWTADEVRKAGGHAGLERMRGLAKAGLLPAFASGGRVGWSKKWQGEARGDYLAARDERRAAERTSKTADKSEDKAWAKRAKQALERAKKAEAAAKSEYEDAKSRTSRLTSSTFDLRRDVARGSIRESFASGNGMSIVDRMFDESGNKDLSKTQRGRLKSLGYSTEKQLLKLEKQADSLAGKLDKATKKRDELLQVQQGVASGLRGEFTLSGLISGQNRDTFSPFTSKTGLAGAKANLATLTDFAGKLDALRKMKFSGAIVEEIASMGTVDGTVAADALLKSTDSEVKDWNSTYKGLDSWSNKAGEYVTNAMEKGGINAAQGLVKGLEGQQKAVDSAFYKLGKSAEKAFKKALGIKSPSTVMAARADDTVDGLVNQLGRRQPDVDRAMSMMGQPPGAYGGWSISSPTLRQAPATPAAVDQSVHVTVEAKEGIAYEYAHKVGQAAAVRVKDTMTAYQLN